ncbi:pre-mRNA-splicing regulator WTAP-like [Tropilaelaps mercedesae]|uniref:Pre-mRNA-splicing regulator WTAP-like n=1 Tax=Tropilaelaps mercedesae TaxID=418985 RepID=A0A1V9XD14_9ACAR|nr:pre-mRNA-splicing regulator WTAP-like [Tropilaelaps mercedesae]
MVGRTESPPPPPPKPTRLTKTELETVGRETLLLRYAECEEYIRFLEATAGASGAAEERQRIKNQLLEVTRRENQLVMKLTIKEQQLQELQSEVESLRARQIPQNSAQLRATLLDPAVNMLFEKMRQELDQTKAKLDETQNELSAWKFTPDSNTGKRLMAKCRLLYQENEELGRMVASGRLAKLEGDLALHRSFAHEMKSSQQEQDEFLLELDEEVEGMQSTIYFLQQELREAKETIARLQGSPSAQMKSRKSPTNSQAEDVDSPSSPKVTLSANRISCHYTHDRCCHDLVAV